MSALAGIWRFDGRADAAGDCRRMLAAQKIYGPHDSAQWSDGGVAIGRNLMRILPEDKFDRQPIAGAHGHVLAADVRLDNREELARNLQIPDGQAHQLSDAAILFAALERWGEDCFGHIVGDYAFAFWNGAQRSLLLARDPLGWRPLHYHRGKHMFGFASMPKGLHALSEIPYGADEERIAEVLALLPARGPRSFFTGIERVEPGHAVKITAEDISIRRHWNPRRRYIKLKNSGEYAEALRAHLDEATRCRLRGTGDVGVMMSGGLDSTAVAATASRLLAPATRRVIAYTAVPREGYDGAEPRGRFIDEGPHAAAVAALYPNMEHVLVQNGKNSPLNYLDSAFFFNEQPISNLCNFGWDTEIGEQMKRRNLSVCLVGSAGNFGLTYEGWELLPELIRSGHWLHWWREARLLPARGPVRWRRVLGQSFGPWCPPKLWTWLNKMISGYADEIGEYSAIRSERLAELDLAVRAKERGADFVFRPAKDSFEQRVACLPRSDPGNACKGSLANFGTEVRDPTADTRLLEFCLAVPTEQFLRNGVPRALARRALADRLPDIVIEERRKGLQSADWHETLSAARNQIAAELGRLDDCPPAARALDLPRLHRLVEQWPQDGWDRPDIQSAYGLALERAIPIGHFLRRVTGGNA